MISFVTVFPHDVRTTTESRQSVRVMVTPDLGRGGVSILNFGVSSALNNVVYEICSYPLRTNAL